MNKLILILIICLTACDLGVGNSSKSDSDNTNNNINTNVNQDDANSSNLVTCKELTLEDGPEGFTWKPDSESDGLPVVLFPVQFAQPFVSVSFTLVAGGNEEAEFSGLTNGQRQTWRLSLSAENYTGGFTIFTQNSECSYVIADPAVRQD